MRESLEGRIEAFGLQNRIGRIMIPTEPVTEIVNGKKRTIERVFLPGYVLVEMELDNDLWHVIKNTPRVTGFLGTGDKPVALSEEEVGFDLLPRRDFEGRSRGSKWKTVRKEQSRCASPMDRLPNFNGIVDEVFNGDRRNGQGHGHDLFGRFSTPVELEFSKVEKVV